MFTDLTALPIGALVEHKLWPEVTARITGYGYDGTVTITYPPSHALKVRPKDLTIIT